MYGNVVYVRLKLSAEVLFERHKLKGRSLVEVIPKVEPTMLQRLTGFVAISITCPCEKACTSGLMILKFILLK